MAVNFDGTNDVISVVRDSSIEPAAITISAWVNTDTAVNGAYTIASKPFTSFSDPYYSYQLRLDNSGGIRVFWVVVPAAYAGRSENIHIAGGNISTGVWSHIVVSYDDNAGDGKRSKMYIDGAEVSTNNVSLTIAYHNMPLTLGRTETIGWYFNGKINETAIWDVALTSAEVAQLYNSKVKGMPLQIQSTNLQSYYPFDDHPHSDVADSANTLVFKDQSSNSNDGTASGCNAQAEEVLSYPANVIIPGYSTGAAPSITRRNRMMLCIGT